MQMGEHFCFGLFGSCLALFPVAHSLPATSIHIAETFEIIGQIYDGLGLTMKDMKLQEALPVPKYAE